jgi:hypothetical protein
VTAWGYNTIEVNATSNPFVINLPLGSTCSGYKLRIINTSALASGLIKINPFAGDKLGPMPASTAIYLQNVDRSAWQNGKKFVELVSDGTGTWAIDGQWMPEPGSVDTAGSQYYLGKLRSLPFVSFTPRNLPTVAIPPALGTYSAAIQVTGILGIPLGAKAVKARFKASICTTAAAPYYFYMAASDNNSTTIDDLSPQPSVAFRGLSTAINAFYGYDTAVDIPLDSSGRMYLFTYTANNVTIGSCIVNLIMLGYYMGD